jgi:hypothetical protein
MTQTPRTDKAGGAVNINGEFQQRDDYQDVVEIVFARQLELETNKLRNAGLMMLRCLERAGTTDCACSSVQAYREKELAIKAWKEVK